MITIVAAPAKAPVARYIAPTSIANAPPSANNPIAKELNSMFPYATIIGCNAAIAAITIRIPAAPVKPLLAANIESPMAASAILMAIRPWANVLLSISPKLVNGTTKRRKEAAIIANPIPA